MTREKYPGCLEAFSGVSMKLTMAGCLLFVLTLIVFLLVIVGGTLPPLKPLTLYPAGGYPESS